MSAQRAGPQGYAYRSYPLALAELQLLAATIFEADPVRAFAAGPLSLQPITSYAQVGAAPLDGDFGHIFSPRFELRWRCQGASYDVLGLAEDNNALRLAGAGMRQIGAFHANVAPAGAAHLQGGDSAPVLYVEYRGELGAVRLLRYSVVDERSEP